MLKFVETKEYYQDLLETVENCRVIIYPVFENERNRRDSNLCFIYIRSIDNNDRYVVNISHVDSFSIDAKYILDTIKYPKGGFVYRYKDVFDIIKGDNIHDLQMVEYFCTNTSRESDLVNNNQYVRFYDIDDKWRYIPIMKQIEYIDLYLNSLMKYFNEFELTPSFTKLSLASSYIFNELEKPGIYTTEGYTYSNYSCYTSTGRVTNTNGKYNFLGLNKKSGIRKKFMTRFRGGRLYQFDYSAYHFRLIGKLIGYDFPIDVNLHEYLAKQIFGKNKITKKEYERAKSDNFSILYSNKPAPDIEFFRKLDIYKRNLFDKFQTQEVINTIIFGRPIQMVNNPDMTDYKLLNYLIQSYETERNMSVMYRLIDLLDGHDSKMILYNYDGFVFDVAPHEIHLLKEIKDMLTIDGFPVTVECGLNYNELESYEI